MADLTSPGDDFAALSHTEKVRSEFDDDVKRSESSESEEREVNDGVHDGLEFPTGEEKLTLRRISDKLPWAAYRKRTYILLGFRIQSVQLSGRLRRTG
jgi:hypothetical protein